MANYKAYPEYKDSGVESLDTIPKMWSIKKLKYIFEIKKRIAGELGFDVLSVTQKGIKIKDIESGEGQLSMDYSKYQRVYPGEFAMNHMDLLTGYVDISNYDGVTSPDYRVFAVRDKHSFYSRYYLYLLQDGYKQRRFFHLGQGSAHLGRWRLPTEAFNEIVYPCPSLKEQIQIASFLDREIAKIDNLIEKQQQLIELLKEKRQAVISHAVTKGLNPDAPMKDSGVEWLGNIPEHWVVSSLKYMAKVIDCKHITAEFSDVGIPVASISEVKSWFVDLSSAKLTNKKDYLSLIDGGRKPVCGDILYSRNATVGEAAIVSDNMPDFAIGQDVCLIKANEKVIPEFILYTLKSDVIAQQLNLAMVGSTFKRINVDDIRNFSIAIPSKNEQVLIVKMLMGKLDKYDRIISNAVDVITYMQERRTALISAAVTGKIDVRDWVAPGTQESEEPQEVSA
ncbi:restriction endonuclease subunit S [Edwardsiella tarda]|uniref:restriction endonuclease subunit S n=1 Tax=Edwardsiella tarda TaxID=636 RepID=UPI00351BF3C5